MSTRRTTFVDTHSLVFWVGLALAVFGAIQVTPLIVDAFSSAPSAGMISALLWGGYAVLLLLILFRLELFERRSTITMLGAFVWGAVVVAGIGVIASSPMHDLVEQLLGPDRAEWTAAIAAPLVEEPLKMLGVVALAFIPAARITSPLDGLFYGLLVGLGFEVTESFLYTVQGYQSQGGALDALFLTFVLRGVIGGLWNHPTYTGITGAGVGYFFGVDASAAKRWSVLIGSLVAAMVLHGLFDSPWFETDPLTSTLVKGIPALGVLLVLLRMARKRDRDLFELVGSHEASSGFASEAELQTLLRKKDRRHARKAVRKQHGIAAAHALKRLQRSQMDYVVTVEDEGVDSPEASEALVAVGEARAVLEHTTTPG